MAARGELAKLARVARPERSRGTQQQRLRQYREADGGDVSGEEEEPGRLNEKDDDSESDGDGMPVDEEAEGAEDLGEEDGEAARERRRPR